MTALEQGLLYAASAVVVTGTLVAFVIQYARGTRRRPLMALLLAVSALVVLLITLVLFVRARRDAPQGTPLPNGRALVLMTLLGLMLALASQLPAFR